MKHYTLSFLFLAILGCKNEVTAPTPSFKFTNVSAGTTADLTDITFSTPSKGFITCSNGDVLVSSDAGGSWQKQSSGSSSGLSAAHFPTESTGYVVGFGGFIGKTTNGGTTWQSIGPSSAGNADPIWDVFFLDASIGFIVQGQAVYRTADGGTTWVKKDLTGLGGSPALSVTFVDTQKGFVSTGDPGTLLRTVDGGTSWTVAATNTGAITDVFFVTANVGYFADHNGVVSKTSNGGLSWTKQITGVSTPLRAIGFFDENQGIATGDNGIVISTTDGGATWKRESAGANGFVEGVKFIGTGNAFIVSSQGAIIKASK